MFWAGGSGRIQRSKYPSSGHNSRVNMTVGAARLVCLISAAGFWEGHALRGMPLLLTNSSALGAAWGRLHDGQARRAPFGANTRHCADRHRAPDPAPVLGLVLAFP